MAATAGATAELEIEVMNFVVEVTMTFDEEDGAEEETASLTEDEVMAAAEEAATLVAGKRHVQAELNCDV